MKIEIKNTHGHVIASHECENNTIKKTLVYLVGIRRNLMGADLKGADLKDANLKGGYLYAADLKGANLTDTNLKEANLRVASFIGANLKDANLKDADLKGGYLTGTNLRHANLTCADLTGTDLRGANLAGANLTEIEIDFKTAIKILPNEIPFLKKVLLEGKIDGSVYVGECCGLASTMAKAKNQHWSDFINDAIFPIDSESPREKWLLGIRQGHTPENNPIVRITLGWIDEVLAEMV